MENDLTELLQMINEVYPDKILVDRSEYEKDKQSYKFLYESLLEKFTEMQTEHASLSFENQDRDREISELMLQVKSLQEENERLMKSSSALLDNLKDYVSQDIIVTSVSVDPVSGEKLSIESIKSNISKKPGVYGSKRPSWFIPIETDFSKKFVSEKNANETKSVIKQRLLFWKKHSVKSANSVLDEYDQERKKNIEELLKDTCSNQEKYLKYFLLSPGLDREFIKTLQGAAELNIEADLVIALLEQPFERFNKEIVELYISELHKANEYAAKMELAQELIDGKWSIRATVNNKEQNCQLVPVEELNGIKNLLEAILKRVSNLADGESCDDSALPQLSPDNHKDESSDIDNSENDIPTFVEFDDSMLD